MLSQLQRNIQHRQAVEGHPSRRISLLQCTTGWQRVRTVEKTYIVKAEKATLENVLAIEILSINPPGEIEQEFLEDPFEKV